MYKITVFLTIMSLSLFLITFTIYKNIKVFEYNSNLLNFYAEYNSISKILPYIESDEIEVVNLNGYKINKTEGIIKITKIKN